MDNNAITKEIEIISVDKTKTFAKAKDDDASLYEFAGGEECIAEFVREPSAECARLLRRMKWRTLKNTRFVVYVAFFVILLVFAIYYLLQKTYYIAALTGIVGAFMAYILLWGEAFFVSGMGFDEKTGSSSKLAVKFCADNIYIFDGEALVSSEYAQVFDFKEKGSFLYFRLKGIKNYLDGVVLVKTEQSPEQIDSIVKKIQNVK